MRIMTQTRENNCTQRFDCIYSLPEFATSSNTVLQLIMQGPFVGQKEFRQKGRVVCATIMLPLLDPKPATSLIHMCATNHPVFVQLHRTSDLNNILLFQSRKGGETCGLEIFTVEVVVPSLARSRCLVPSHFESVHYRLLLPR